MNFTVRKRRDKPKAARARTPPVMMPKPMDKPSINILEG
jgi:hypothetical protein